VLLKKSSGSRKQSQVQSQKVNIESPEHGVTDEITCAFFDSTSTEMPSWQRKKALQQKSVKVLFFRGEVKRVFCHLLLNKTCTSKLNDREDKSCFILEEKKAEDE
jgi:hypothetical protein